MQNNSYPNEFFRGISSNDFIDSGFVTDSAFQLDDCLRKDGYQEMSINWNDDSNALDTLFNQINTNKNGYQFCYAARLSMQKIRCILSDHIKNSNLKFERSPMPDNKYHGNILVLKSASKPIKRLIRNGLATIVGSDVIKNSNIK